MQLNACAVRERGKKHTMREKEEICRRPFQAKPRGTTLSGGSGQHRRFPLPLYLVPHRAKEGY